MLCAGNAVCAVWAAAVCGIAQGAGGAALICSAVVVGVGVSGGLLSSLPQALTNRHKDAAKTLAQSVRNHAPGPCAKRLPTEFSLNKTLHADLANMGGL